MMKTLFTSIFILSFSFLSASPWADRVFKTVEEGSEIEISKLIATDYFFPEYTRGEKQNVLMAALENSREKNVISLILDAGTSPDAKDKNGKTALMYACENENDVEVIRTVLEYKASDAKKEKRILAKDNEGKNSFDYSLENEKKDEVYELLASYASPPLPSIPEPEEPLQVLKTAAARDDIKDINFPLLLLNEEELPALLSYLSLPGPAEIEEPVLADEIEEKTEIQTVKLEETVQVSEPEPVEIPAPVNTFLELDKLEAPVTQAESIYLYDYAITEGSIGLISTSAAGLSKSFNFIENADEKDKNGRTKLMLAAKKGDSKKILDLLYSGSQINARDNDGWTALMYAVRFQNSVDAVKILLKNNASPLVKNNFNANALMIAAGYAKNPQIIEEMISSFDPLSEDLRSAFVYGIKSSNLAENLKPFIDKKTKLNIPYNGKTYLMYACESNKDTSIIKLLLDNGADKKQVIDGKTAFDYARENTRLRHDNVYRLLSED